jgi:Ca2+-binding EF-hand superfamily protein
MRTKEIAMRLAVIPLLIVGTTALLTTTAGATDPAKPHDPRAVFAEADTNKDGSIDLAEFHTRLVEVFYNTDTNKDGVLVIDEYVRLPVSSGFKEADGDGDGKLSMDEFIAIRYRQYKVADKNSDGQLSVGEVVEAYEGAPR